MSGLQQLTQRLNLGIKMTMEKGSKQKIEMFLTKYPETIEFTRQSKEFQHAHAKLFELIEYVLNQSNDLTPED